MKVGIVTIFIGWFLLRAEIENLVTKIIPSNYEIPLGIILILYGLWRFKK